MAHEPPQATKVVVHPCDVGCLESHLEDGPRTRDMAKGHAAANAREACVGVVVMLSEV
jgi:hypothetical protein